MKLNNLDKRPSPAVKTHWSKKVANLVKMLSQSLGDYEVANDVKNVFVSSYDEFLSLWVMNVENMLRQKSWGVSNWH